MSYLISRSSFVFGNEDEIAHFAKTHDLIKESQNTEECYFDICEKLHAKFHHNQKIFVVTRGSRPIVVSTGPG